jgi:hypothetical protein
MQQLYRMQTFNKRVHNIGPTNERRRPPYDLPPAAGTSVTTTTTTESPRRNNMLKDLSLFTPVPFLLPFPVRADSDHNDQIVKIDRPACAFLHLCDVLQYQVKVSIKGFHVRQQLSVIPAADQDLCVTVHRPGRDGQGARGKFRLLKDPQFFLGPAHLPKSSRNGRTMLATVPLSAIKQCPCVASQGPLQLGREEKATLVLPSAG